jgi:hypothetical protein
VLYYLIITYIYQEKNMLVQNELLTPQGLVEMLKHEFRIYRDEQKLDSLKDETVATSWIKQKAAAAYESTLKHKALTDFVIRQMDEILAEAGSLEKKMTDLTILFYGLYNYMTLERHSAHLSPKLEIVRRALWAATPHHEVQLAPEGYETVAVWQAARDVAQQALAADAPDDALPPIFRNPLEVKVVYDDEDQFKQSFDVQILRAQDLMRCNTTEKDQAAFANFKKSPIDAYTVVKAAHSLDSKHNITPTTALILHYPTWHYKVLNQIDREAHHAHLNATNASLRGAFRGTKEQVAFACTQWTVEEARPFPNMGVTYHHHLAQAQVHVDAAAQEAAVQAQAAQEAAAQAAAAQAAVAEAAAQEAAAQAAAAQAAAAEAAAQEAAAQAAAALAHPAAVPAVPAPAPAAAPATSIREKAASVFAGLRKKMSPAAAARGEAAPVAAEEEAAAHAAAPLAEAAQEAAAQAAAAQAAAAQAAAAEAAAAQEAAAQAAAAQAAAAEAAAAQEAAAQAAAAQAAAAQAAAAQAAAAQAAAAQAAAAEAVAARAAAAQAAVPAVPARPAAAAPTATVSQEAKAAKQKALAELLKQRQAGLAAPASPVAHAAAESEEEDDKEERKLIEL